jgi:hypothetical protein
MEIVYILTNPVMPGVIKIGKTDKDDVTKRVKKLFTTGVPVPFDCVYACEVSDNTIIEKELHTKFARYRINPNREFFWLTPKTAAKALQSYEISDVTPDLRAEADKRISESEKNARWEARQKILKTHPEYAKGKNLHSRIQKSDRIAKP